MCELQSCAGMSTGSTNTLSFHVVVISKHRRVWMHGHMHSACVWLVHAIHITIMRLHIDGFRRIMTLSNDWWLCGSMITMRNCRYFPRGVVVCTWLGDLWVLHWWLVALPPPTLRYTHTGMLIFKTKTYTMPWWNAMPCHTFCAKHMFTTHFGIYDVWITSLISASYCTNTCTVNHYNQKNNVYNLLCVNIYNNQHSSRTLHHVLKCWACTLYFTDNTIHSM